MYDTAAELLQLAEAKGVPLHEIVLRAEEQLTGQNEEAVRARVLQSYGVMRHSAKAALEHPESLKRKTLINGQAKRLYDLKDGVCGPLVQKAAACALSCLEVNASMGRICAAPTAGACGILPAVVLTLAEEFQLGDNKITDALLTASGIGAVVMNTATVSGAKGGCQAECGVAAAMAAAAAVCLRGGTNTQCLHAASMALINAMGLVCDPIGGLVQIPCAYRNATQAANALTCADMALAGIDPLIPFDEVVNAMAEVGEMLPPALRETAKGGIAASPTAQKIMRDMELDGCE